MLRRRQGGAADDQKNLPKSKKTGGMVGKVDFVPLKMRVHGNLNVTTGSFASTSTEAPETKLATPIKRSALNVELDVGDTDLEDSELLSSPARKLPKT
ncbi:BZ3500_MvSof-1268-A1-R1_Chr12-2g03805 [Microbotryum saponariae]|uniref:BZ3500_MvSof-1268-A1-R1_Chr12-2g03805 protein n=1 Tax=Microbotryum saponariae TaxID=289078 RepID=A0A2X0KRR1_9BASI|nr:BZ3500_MvSof-1268-A1-R1_Chr12-2g03805 [Microbotryum saponariae]